MDIVFFRLYLIVLFTLLLFLSFFISRQLLGLIINNYKLNKLVNNFKKDNLILLNAYSFVNCYLLNGELFLSISFCEFFVEFSADVNVKIVVFTLLGYLYNQEAYYSISEYYYYKALSLSPDNDQVISDLGKMYDYLGCKVNY